LKKKRILIDNNCIDTILENLDFYENMKSKYEFCVCTSVVEELANIPDTNKEKRITVFICLAKIEAKFLPDSVFVAGHSRTGVACVSNAEIYHKILCESKSNISDAIIAETAVRNNCMLLTNDLRLYKKMKDNNYDVITFEDLKNANK
jgi:rRNA-processing protein FCF1